MKACQICLSTFDDAVRFCPLHGSELKPVTTHQFLPGETICGYYLKNHIGRDGLGDLFCATKGGNSYRFRLYSGALLSDPGRVSRLHAILEKSFQVTGGGIPIIDFDWLDDGSLYSAHPYIPGRSFHDILALGLQLNETDIADLLLQLLKAVKDIHSQRIVNGNIALSNIILDNSGRVRLHDVGLWDVLRSEHFDMLCEDHPEVFNDIIDLMSPEVARGEAPGFQSDVYSCGAAACCLIRNKLDPGSASERINKHLSGEILDFRDSNPSLHVSPDFADLLDASMLGNSGIRFQTTRAFITALVSIHNELDDSSDALSPSLAERILSGAEKPVMRSSTDSTYSMTAVDAAPMDSVSNSKSEIFETTRHGIDPERTVVEKASWDDLANLVGENLETSAITDMLDRAVTTEMDPFEASPTQELPAPIFVLDNGNGPDSISNILDSLTQTDSSDAISDKKSNDSSITASACAILNSLTDDSFSSSDTEELPAPDLDDLPGLPFKDVTTEKELVSPKPELPADESVSAPETNESSAEETTSRESNSEDSSPNKEKSKKSKKSKKSNANAATSKENETQNNNTESEKETSTAQNADALPDSTKPHKRIGKKKSEGSDDLERGDVISVSTSMEMRRIKRHRRTDFAPQNEIVEAEVIIHPLQKPSDKPEYCAIPWMTTTCGYKKGNDNSTASDKASKDIAECITAEIESPEFSNDTQENAGTVQSESDFFDEKENDSAHWYGNELAHNSDLQTKKRILLAAIFLMLIFCAVLAILLFTKEKTPEQPSADIWSSRIEEFQAELAKGTPESRKSAIQSLRSMRKDGLEREQLQTCRKEMISTFMSQADTMRKKLQKSEEISNPLEIGDTITQLNIQYNTCIAAIDITQPESAELKQSCDLSKQNALLKAQSDAYDKAQNIVPTLQIQSAGWTTLADIYQDLVDNTKRHPDKKMTEDLATSLYEATTEKANFEKRLKAIESEGTRLAALTVPAETPHDVVEQPSETNEAAVADAQPVLAQPEVVVAMNQPTQPVPVAQPVTETPKTVQPEDRPKVLTYEDVMPSEPNNDAKAAVNDPGIKIPVNTANNDPGIKIPVKTSETADNSQTAKQPSERKPLSLDELIPPDPPAQNKAPKAVAANNSESKPQEKQTQPPQNDGGLMIPVRKTDTPAPTTAAENTQKPVRRIDLDDHEPDTTKPTVTAKTSGSSGPVPSA